ncbi:hypothetical protein BGX23_003966 [Mortierella sp. AD031]|nr:hypothetical protein BGX23_003966 [Mortierella sp. AD031]KAG0219097.1 hypothetical protein BGX33_004667 [Mortierella sp. NVP41]
MVRHEKNLGATHVAWGYDEGMQGYFLTITDNRLGWREGQSAEVTKVCEKISEDGGGHYLDLNTYPVTGFGHKVSKETMFTFMKRYGIDPEEIGSTDTDTVGGGTKECAHPDCRMPETVHKRCARCKSVWYCSKACQTADWKTHKVDCKEA